MTDWRHELDALNTELDDVQRRTLERVLKTHIPANDEQALCDALLALHKPGTGRPASELRRGMAEEIRKSAVVAERERCAKIAETQWINTKFYRPSEAEDAAGMSQEIAEAIRKGEP